MAAGLWLLARPWWSGVVEQRGQAELAASASGTVAATAEAPVAAARAVLPVAPRPAVPDGPAMPALIPLGNWWPPGPVPHVYAHLSIPAIGLRTFVVRGITLTDYYDLMAWGPAHLHGSAEPGGAGNAVILGHVDEFGSPFRLLDRLRHGDAIDLIQGGRTFRYIVQTSWSVKPTDVAVVGPLGRGVRALTLITCDGLANTRRLVVRAVAAPGAGGSAGGAPPGTGGSASAA